MKFVSIVGARPQFIKVAPFARAIDRHNNDGGESLEHIIIHRTGDIMHDASFLLNNTASQKSAIVSRLSLARVLFISNDENNQMALFRDKRSVISFQSSAISVYQMVRSFHSFYGV